VNHVSLEGVSRDIFTKYGLTDNDIKVYIGYLGWPHATISEIMTILQLDYDTVWKITEKLEKSQFLKKIEGNIERYVPLEPYFSSLSDNLKKYRSEISAIKDQALAAQSGEYDELDASDGREIDASIQKVKDKIADATLTFMNRIDDARDNAEKHEDMLAGIHDAAHVLSMVEPVNTWFVIGKAGLITYLKDVIWRTKASIIIVTPVVVPEILELLAQVAYERKAQKFFFTSHWNLAQYGDIIRKMNVLGNIQFRQLKTEGEYWAVTRDAEEIMLAPETPKDEDLVCLVSDHPGYAKLYSQFIGPMFQANSQPLKI